MTHSSSVHLISSVKHLPRDSGQAQPDDIFDQPRVALRAEQVKGGTDIGKRVFERAFQRLPHGGKVGGAQPEAQRNRVVAAAGEVVRQILAGVYQVDPAPGVVEQLPQDALLPERTGRGILRQSFSTGVYTTDTTSCS